jgi:hypothetical protein
MITNQVRGHSAPTPNKSPSYAGPFIRSQSPGDHFAGTSAPDELAQRISIGLTFWPFRPFRPLVPTPLNRLLIHWSLEHSLVIGPWTLDIQNPLQQLSPLLNLTKYFNHQIL